MALTRQLLKDLQLNDESIEQIIAAHISTVDALKAERDAAFAELQALRESSGQSAAEVQAAFDAYRTQVEAHHNTAKALELVRLAMLQAGCNEKAIDLLIQAIDPATLKVEGGSLKNEAAIIAELRSKYAAFFAQPVRMATPTIQPPIPTGGALTREDISRMSADEINRNWNAVKSVLAKGAI
ncbi:MAG: hypothetical protein E7316_10510 [Clostridiales bacterium]|nr:hypothetical protein [Clostridiales bacterium]